MIHVFISYGGRDREFARQLADKINDEFKNKLTIRIIEDENAYDGSSWKEKIIKDLTKASIFIIIFTQNSISRPWPNQELGYAFALLRSERIKSIIPVVEADISNGRINYIELKGLITDDMDKIAFELNNPENCIEKIILEIKKMDLENMAQIEDDAMSELEENELAILKHIIITSYKESHQYFEAEHLQTNFTDINLDYVRDTLDLLKDKSILSYNHGLYKLTPHGFYKYGPVFLDINIQEHVDMVFNAIIEFKKPGKMCTGESIFESTKLPPSEINFIVELLELNEYIEVMRTIGTGEYAFRSVNLTHKGRRAARKD